MIGKWLDSRKRDKLFHLFCRQDWTGIAKIDSDKPKFRDLWLEKGGYHEDD